MMNNNDDEKALAWEEIRTALRRFTDIEED